MWGCFIDYHWTLIITNSFIHQCFLDCPGYKIISKGNENEDKIKVFLPFQMNFFILQLFQKNHNMFRWVSFMISIFIISLCRYKSTVLIFILWLLATSTISYFLTRWYFRHFCFNTYNLIFIVYTTPEMKTKVLERQCKYFFLAKSVELTIHSNNNPDFRK